MQSSHVPAAEMDAAPAEKPVLLGPVEVGAPAHGGHCVARVDGRVVFVRHALPGEVVTIEVTDTTHRSYWRGDAVEVHTASPERAEPVCPVAVPGGCGGCDLQHVSPSGQLEWKESVVAELLAHKGFRFDGPVEPVSPTLGWRTRMRYVATPTGWGMRAHHSHRVVELPGECAISSTELPPALAGVAPDSAEEVAVVDSGSEVVAGTPGELRTVVTEEAIGRDFAVDADGFWQIHPESAETLVAAVLDGLEPQRGERAFDLYCGVGLFAAALIDAGCAEVWGVESSRPAVNHAQANVPAARFSVGRVEQRIRSMPARTDLVVLDPPRTGAGKKVMAELLGRRPRRVAYVACDPAALARDLAYAAELGWKPQTIRAFDLFPQTHHVECVAILVPAT